MNDVIEKLGFLSGGSRLRRIYEKMQAGGDKAYKEAGLDFKSSWFPVYYVLANSQGPLTVMEITDRIAFTHITVKNIVRELESVKLVKIKANPNDKRSKHISLTKKGENMLKRLEPLWLSFSIVLKDVLTSGHPEIINILEEIDGALDASPLNERVRALNTRDDNIQTSRREYSVRNARPSEYKEIGKLMVKVYSQLEGFPKEDEQPDYYKMLLNVGDLTRRPATEILAAVSPEGKIAGCVVYFSDMQYYGSGGAATQEKNAAGFRLLAVDTGARGKGLGKLLTCECIRKARELKLEQVIIHTTKAMQTAWKMYEKIGFKRSEELDFMQGELPVFGFRLML